MMIMNKQRIKEIIESHGVIEVRYKDNPVWLESIGSDQDGKIQVKDLVTNKQFSADIKDLKE